MSFRALSFALAGLCIPGRTGIAEAHSHGCHSNHSCPSEGEVGGDADRSGPPWPEVAEAVKGVLSGTTIAQVAEREAQAAGTSMYYI